ncbi:hypothetical protein DAEQUDRAFT_172606 [Daedalea quercina L-15889]|uniref:Uncharacterized protein n=1 Tax=Daedalea quercina L-15889 TaxID=1314783 RepID=A0A165KJA6_9APHY|nr:hypothetical protein DAEQUDRAFT_172606 [Daedalea quercina L-15889]
MSHSDAFLLGLQSSLGSRLSSMTTVLATYCTLGSVKRYYQERFFRYQCYTVLGSNRGEDYKPAQVCHYGR